MRKMRKRILMDVNFRKPLARDDGWEQPAVGNLGAEVTAQKAEWVIGGEGTTLCPGAKRAVRLDGAGVHTRNGDSIELKFRSGNRAGGVLQFTFAGGMEHAGVKLDLAKERASIVTSEWSRPQPVKSAKVKVSRSRSHILRLEKKAFGSSLRENASVAVYLDGKKILQADDIDILPEIGVMIEVLGGSFLLERFVHRGVPSGVPEFLRVGGYQVLNVPDIDANLEAIKRGLTQAADAGVRLLVTPETCLTGLAPTDAVTKNPAPIAAAERKLRRFIAGLKNAPYLIAGLPVWEKIPGHRRSKTRLNASRVYAPDGGIVATCPKVHSCETEIWHGYALGEFDIEGVPCSMHICHDVRYPDTWTLPVMFGARLIIHPSNGGLIGGSVDAFEKSGRRVTHTAHAFYVNVNGGGGSQISGPHKFNNLLAVSDECTRDQASFPAVGKPAECLLSARLRIHDAFGYWPVRSSRCGDETALAYQALYKSMGGSRLG